MGTTCDRQGRQPLDRTGGLSPRNDCRAGQRLAQGAEPPPFTSDGWYTWRVDAVDDASDWCCYRWNAGQSVKGRCDLDDGNRGFSISDDSTGPAHSSSGEIQIYARFSAGDLTQLRTLSPSCGVDSDSPWTDLGKVNDTQSLAWLADTGPSTRHLQDERLVAIAAHSGAESRQALVDIATSSGDRQQREQAIFWMGQLRVEETREELLALMNNGDSEKIREQAIFSYAQSPADDRLEVLIAVIEDRRKPMHDRQQALFWLAQADDSAGVNYIQQLLLSN